MAVALSQLANGTGLNNVDASSFATSSVTLTANRLYIFCVFNGVATAPATTPTVTGASQTWVNIGNGHYQSDTRGITMFRCMPGSGQSGALTIDFGGITQSGAAWSVIEVTGMDTAGVNGDGAIEQVVVDDANSAGTEGTVILGQIKDSLNYALGFFCHNTAEATAPAGSWTELTDQNGTSPVVGFQVEYKNNDAIPDATWTTSSTWAGIGIEIRDINAAPKGGAGWGIPIK